jgi:ribosome maturation factor RimP
MAKDLKARMTRLLDAAATERGFELVLLETGGPAKEPYVRVYLDHEGGITIEQIALANKWIDAALADVTDLPEGYTLEVSSPGIERPLVKLADFVRFVGSDAKVTVSREIDGHKQFTGTISAVDGTDVLLQTEDGTTVPIPHTSITRANLRVTIDFSKEGTGDDGI